MTLEYPNPFLKCIPVPRCHYILLSLTNLLTAVTLFNTLIKIKDGGRHYTSTALPKVTYYMNTTLQARTLCEHHTAEGRILEEHHTAEDRILHAHHTAKVRILYEHHIAEGLR